MSNRNIVRTWLVTGTLAGAGVAWMAMRQRRTRLLPERRRSVQRGTGDLAARLERTEGEVLSSARPQRLPHAAPVADDLVAVAPEDLGAVWLSRATETEPGPRPTPPPLRAAEMAESEGEEEEDSS